MALEIMINTPAIRNLIREEKIHQIYSAMQAGTKFGMQTLNQSLGLLVQRGLITRDDAMNRSTLPDELNQLLSGMASRVAAEATPFARH
jgi:twitching motility protein PilT